MELKEGRASGEWNVERWKRGSGEGPVAAEAGVMEWACERVEGVKGEWRRSSSSRGRV